MRSLVRNLLSAAAIAALSWPALAADPRAPEIVESPPVVYAEQSFGGWYLRGDIDFHATEFRGGDYITYGPPPGTNDFDFGEIDESWSLGGGIGYQITRHLRADVTADYMFEADFRGQTTGDCGGVPCVTVDTSTYSALLLLANAYVDLGTWHKVTPYVGAGIGGAWVEWDDLTNDGGGGFSFTHRGASNWRFAYALMAGASYCLTSRTKLDLGYRYSRIEGGRMFEFDAGAAIGPGFDDGMHIHEGRAGLRYQFGKSDCAPEPEPIPMPAVYK